MNQDGVQLQPSNVMQSKPSARATLEATSKSLQITVFANTYQFNKETQGNTTHKYCHH